MTLMDFIGNYWLYVLIPLCFGFLLLRQAIINRAPTNIAQATVVSRRAAPARFHSKWSSGWNYYVTFQLNDGDTVELNTGEEAYNSLTEGLQGILRWQNEDFREFDSDD